MKTYFADAIFRKRFENKPIQKQAKNFIFNKNNKPRLIFEEIRYFGPLIWRSLPIEIKNSESLTKFQTLIKCWKPVCPYKLCKTYIPELGFLQC